MAVTFGLKVDGIKTQAGENPRAEISYWAEGSDDHATVDAAFLAYLAINLPSWGSLSRVGYSIDATEREDLWDCKVMFGFPNAAASTPSPAVGDSSWSFDTTGGTARITQARSHLADYATGPTVLKPNHQGALNVDSDGKAEGIDIIVPAYKWSETHYLDPAIVTNAYKGALFYLTGKMNLAPFRGLKAGECLFLGARGGKRGSDKWEISYDFSGSMTVTGASYGQITGVSKLGWDYIWFEHQREVQTEGDQKRIVTRLRAVHVERVFEFADFGLLQIGTE